MVYKFINLEWAITEALLLPKEKSCRVPRTP
jgi:hypothetical protein